MEYIYGMVCRIIVHTHSGMAKVAPRSVYRKDGVQCYGVLLLASSNFFPHSSDKNGLFSTVAWLFVLSHAPKER